MNSRNKKILVLVGKITDKKGKLAKLITSLIGPKTEIKMDLFSNLTFEAEGETVVVKVSGIDIKSFDLVFIRSVDSSLAFTAGILAYVLDHIHIKYFDKKFLNSRATSDKLTSLVILGLNGLPIVPTFFCERDSVIQYSDYLVKKFNYPIVAKELKTHHSQGLFVLRHKEDFQKLDGRQFLFQKFVPLEEEYRFLVLGNSVRSVQKMYRDLSGSRSRIDMNRKEEFVDVTRMPIEMKDLAVRCAKALNLQVAGVDLMIAKEDSKTFVIEVNGNPGFTYDTNISPEVPELAKFLEEEVQS
jgi:glutathione synthase/RimK-type ligase-like ATP-grasp enzyme